VRFFSPIRPLLKWWVVSFIGWGFVAFLLGAQFVSRTSAPWSDAIQHGIRDWLPWAILTPLLFRLVSRVPLDRPHWRTALPIHLVCCVAVIVATHWWRHEVVGYPRPQFQMKAGPPRGEGNRPPGIRGEFIGPPPPGRGGDRSPRQFRGGPGGPPRGFFDLLYLTTFQLPIYLMLMSAGHAALFYRRSQERAVSLARARLESLRMQLQPHFLFNTLNTIAGLVHDEPDKADAMLVALSDLLRMNLETSSELELPLRRELESADRYLALMHARFEDRLRFHIDIDPDTNAALVPSFILQPLVENAVRHGLQPKSEGGTVKIRAWKDGGNLHVTVADDGVGLSDPETRREGIGLANTRARLRELYGAGATLDLRANGGTICELTLPFHTAT
jgi:hypothetical protein